jgi:hypothetical protein
MVLLYMMSVLILCHYFVAMSLLWDDFLVMLVFVEIVIVVVLVVQLLVLSSFVEYALVNQD